MKPSRDPYLTPPDSLRLRLNAYSRYAMLLTEQLEAIQEEDMERFSSLAKQRDRVAEDLGALPEPGMARGNGTVRRGTDDESGEAAGLREAVSRQLDRCMVLDREVRRRLTALREETRAAIRDLDRNRPRVRKYFGEPSRSAPTIDIRS